MLSIARYLFSGAVKGKAGSLYTWGTVAESIGRIEQNKKKPMKVEGFDGKVSKVCMGPSHSALITSNGYP